MKENKRNVLVTGGAGFIGSHVAGELILMGYRVIVIDDLSGGFLDNVPKGAKFVRGSINDFALLSRLFKLYKFDYVFHLAAYAAEGLSHFIKRFNYTNNVIGSVNLINESVKNNEGLTPKPENSYGIAKFAVELELKACQKMFGLNYIIFRLHNVYGENQNIGDKYRNVIGIFLNNIMKNIPLVIFGDGKQTRAFSYISDVAPLIARSIKKPVCYGQTFNVGTDKPYTIDYLAQVVIQAMSVKGKIVHVEARNEVKHAYSSHAKIRKIFGSQQSVGLEEGVARMAQWVQRVGVRKNKDFKAIEIHKNLPSVWKK